LRNHEDLSDEDEQSRALSAAALPEIELAWQLTEALCSWHATAYATRASAGLDTWIAAVKGSGPKELRQALSAIRNWRREILAFFDFMPTRLSNGFVEGENGK
jgi:transposase